MTQFNLSARVYHHTRSVKLAPTIAILVGSEDIQSVHLAEALQYRLKLMMGQVKSSAICYKSQTSELRLLLD